MRRFSKSIVALLLAWICCNCQKTSSEKQATPTLSPIGTDKDVRQTFDYEQKLPVNGTLCAVIELGSFGLNYFIINLDVQGRWKLIHAHYGRSNIIYGSGDTDSIISTVLNYKDDILSRGVLVSNIHCVASSSVVFRKGLKEINQEAEKINVKFISINAAYEAQLALTATVPAEFADESFLVDIGSGNTKISWVGQKGDTLSGETHGSKYYLDGIPDTTAFREVRATLLEVPEDKRNLCFMLGGAVYRFVKARMKLDTNRYVVLRPPSAYPRTSQELKAGNVIYSALYQEPTYAYIFDSHANFAIGYLIHLRRTQAM